MTRTVFMFLVILFARLSALAENIIHPEDEYLLEIEVTGEYPV